MDNLDYDLINGEDTQIWQEALDLVNTNEMPPEKAKAHFSPAERSLFVDLLTLEIRKAVEAKRSTGGRTVLRRLTTYEYENTLKDLLGVDRAYAKDLPPESLAKEGFKNNSSIMGFSPLHLEHFERIARESLESIINIPEIKPDVIHWHVKPEKAFLIDKGTNLSKEKQNYYNEVIKKIKVSPKDVFGMQKWTAPGAKKYKDIFNKNIYRIVTPVEDYKNRNRAYIKFPDSFTSDGIILSGNYAFDTVKNVLAPPLRVENYPGNALRSGCQPEFRMEMYDTPNIPRSGPVTVRVEADCVKGKNGEFPVLYCEFSNYDNRFSVVGKKVGEVEVKKKGIYEFRFQAENFPVNPLKMAHHNAPVVFTFFNSYSRGTARINHKDLPKLIVKSAEVTFNDYQNWPPKSYRRIMYPTGTESFKPEIVISSFAERAFRRPLQIKEKQEYIQFYNDILKRGSDKKSALTAVLTSVLCSPSFLMMIEPAENGNSKRKLNSFEFATRLSYFLWSTMPDKRLLSLAADESLANKKRLEEEIDRMIKDSRSEKFVKNFSSQWLNLDKISQVAVNPDYFNFDENDRAVFEQETVEFVNQVLKDDLTIFNFIHSDFALLNSRLARHYGIKGVSGHGFRKVKLGQKSQRGGVLTHAGILLANSNGGETHPIKRGIWLLERILNDPPPPPPPSVPELGRIDPSLSLKERLREHAKDGACKDCHSKIDPWGVAFENYNALGQWRQGTVDLNVKPRYRKVNVDPSTKLKNGKELKNLNDLKNYLINERKDQLLRALVSKVLSYAIGRYTDYTDREDIEKICQAVKDDGWKFSAVIRHVILSEPFNTK